MAVKARAEVTLVLAVDVKAVYRYYLLQSSTLSKPAKPTQWPPGGRWVDTEPGYTSGSTNSLYCVDCTVLSDETFIYSEVSLSSSYEAAKEAYNKAQAAQEAVGKKNTVYYQAEEPDGDAYAVHDLWFDTSRGNAMYCWDGSQWVAKQFGTDALAVGSVTAEKMDVEELFAQEIVASGSIQGLTLKSPTLVFFLDGDPSGEEGGRIELKNGIRVSTAAGLSIELDSSRGIMLGSGPIYANGVLYADKGIYLGGNQLPVIKTGSLSSITVPASNYKDVTVSFGYTYTEKPRVFVTLSTGSASSNMGLLQISVPASNITETGCTIRFYNAHTAQFIPTIQWMAVGN